MHKKIIGICLAICLSGAQPTMAQNLPALKTKAIFTIDNYQVNIDGQDFNVDAAPFVVHGRTYLPIRFLGDALGAETRWKNGEMMLIAQDRIISLKPDTLFINVDGKYQLMDVVPITVPPGRVCLPARYVCEAAGYAVAWDNTLNAMVVSKDNSPVVTTQQSTGIISEGKMERMLTPYSLNDIMTYDVSGLPFAVDGVTIYSIAFNPPGTLIVTTNKPLVSGIYFDRNWTDIPTGGTYQMVNGKCEISYAVDESDLLQCRQIGFEINSSSDPDISSGKVNGKIYYVPNPLEH